MRNLLFRVPIFENSDPHEKVALSPGFRTASAATLMAGQLPLPGYGQENHGRPSLRGVEGRLGFGVEGLGVEGLRVEG